MIGDGSLTLSTARRADPADEEDPCDGTGAPRERRVRSTHRRAPGGRDTGPERMGSARIRASRLLHRVRPVLAASARLTAPSARTVPARIAAGRAGLRAVVGRAGAAGLRVVARGTAGRAGRRGISTGLACRSGLGW
ncbi:hypothetical protein GCM10011608_38630 [Micromonospora sonchi]|uniref:Uncharacterized protein n=1 Tax=Micromonospora sonchi TaxID=1763543 RepID=A0A917U3A1_9ACTN|nr:hypothetical protein GCM10011608_38630 [Micromonospora sonchi]